MANFIAVLLIFNSILSLVKVFDSSLEMRTDYDGTFFCDLYAIFFFID